MRMETRREGTELLEEEAEAREKCRGEGFGVTRPGLKEELGRDQLPGNGTFSRPEQ